ncbi:MAG TPA: hypothetical protein VFA67_14050 [Candidatus Sulfotelmatobacter sp.]|nr:hypothetical protein [Candidatus Sulfotelmatobacter sp.]
MRSRLILFTLCLYLAFALGCNKPPAADNSNDPNATDQNASAGTDSTGNAKESGRQPRERKERKEPRREHLTVPAGTAVTVSLGSALGSKLSQSGQSFNGSVAKDVMVGNAVAIPQGANVSGTVTDAKPLGKFAGGAVLSVRLDSITVNGIEVQVQSEAKTFNQKGKGKRTAVATGGGAALGGIIGGLVGGGKGAAIGLAAGAGAGAGGSALTGNKDIVLPAESAVTFELSQPLELRR